MIEFKRLEQNNKEHYIAKHKWISDCSINHLFIPQFVPMDIVPPSLEEMMSYFDKRETTKNYMIYYNNEIIGDFQIDYNFDMLYSKEPSAWIGITIGEESARGKKIGSKVMKFIEEEVKQDGFCRIELGVFEFNTKAIAFYEKLGYKRIGEIKGFTYYNGSFHSDFRYEKRLN
jgi:RimJ/RimL family protein N-acetyltransferase